MTAITMHAACVPLIRQMLGSLSRMLAKADGPQAATLLEARLAPDMLPLVRQVQIASDAAKLAVARLAGEAAPSMPDTETTIAELQDRIAATLAYVDTVAPERLDGSEDREIVIKARGTEMRFTGLGYLTGFFTPNFLFHVTTAYAILRHNGVELGKRDFLGGA